MCSKNRNTTYFLGNTNFGKLGCHGKVNVDVHFTMIQEKVVLNGLEVIQLLVRMGGGGDSLAPFGLNRVNSYANRPKFI